MRKFLKWKYAPAVTLFIGLTAIISPIWVVVLTFALVGLIVYISYE
jgi:hypothetical protein